MTSPSPANLAELWRDYRAGPTVALRNALVVYYLPLVLMLAHQLHRSLCRRVSVADLKQNGMIGLLHAVERYDPERGVKFEVYSSRRIIGAMVDGMRAMDWVPQRARGRGDHVPQFRTLNTSCTHLEDIAGDRVISAQTVADPKAGDPSDRMQRADAVAACLAAMTAAERDAATAYYIDGKSRLRHAIDRDCSPSWVTHLHKTFIRRLGSDPDLRAACAA